jgi:hypothetical protein
MDREVRFSLVGVKERSFLIGGYLGCNRDDVGPVFDGKGS